MFDFPVLLCENKNLTYWAFYSYTFLR